MTEDETKWVIIWLEKVRDICSNVSEGAQFTPDRSVREAWMTKIDTAHEISQQVKRLMIEAIG